MKHIILPEEIQKAVEENQNNLSLYQKIMVRLFNIPFPYALTHNEWNEYCNILKKYYPIYYLITEVIYGFLQCNIIWPFSRFCDIIQNFIRYRITKKYHIIKTGLKPNYYTNDERILNGLFNILKDFVELSRSRMCKLTDGEIVINAYDTNRDLGLKFLDWLINMNDEHQSGTAKEMKELYLWWVDVRPNRKDPWDDEILNSLPELSWLEIEEQTDPNADIRRERRNIAYETERKYEKEDEEMLIRLIKIRQGLVS